MVKIASFIYFKMCHATQDSVEFSDVTVIVRPKDLNFYVCRVGGARAWLNFYLGAAFKRADLADWFD